MTPIKVFVENWQSTPWHIEWIPIIIAIIALITSLISLYWTREEFIRNTRPFVWASNYGVIDHEHNALMPVPHKIALRVKNSPAKISNLVVNIFLDDVQLFGYTDENCVRFPDETSEWAFSVGKDDFERIMNRPADQQSRLRRIVTIEYSGLGGRKKYHYKLEQSYNPLDNQWRDNNVLAD